MSKDKRTIRKVSDLLPSEAILISSDSDLKVLEEFEKAGMNWADGEKATEWNPTQVGYNYPFVLIRNPIYIGSIAFRVLPPSDFIEQ